jgi:5-methylcytosine-specific restriction protein A
MPVRPPTYRAPGQRSKRQANAEYDARRGGGRERGYSTQWEKDAAAFKQQHPYCLGCRAVGRSEATALVDHVLPHKGSQALMWNRRNWQPSCRFHHDVVKQRLEVLYAKGEVKAADLWLDGAKAIEITRELCP